MTRRRIGTVSDVRDQYDLADGAEAWEFIIAHPDITCDKADGEDKPWVVWIDE